MSRNTIKAATVSFMVLVEGLPLKGTGQAILSDRPAPARMPTVSAQVITLMMLPYPLTDT